MSKRVQILGLTNAVIVATIGFARELIIDTDNGVLTLHDGVTTGGIRIARQDLTNCADATGTVAGRMSAVDKAKLDLIAAGATNSPFSNATPVAETFGVVGAAGVAVSASRSDHVHALAAVVNHNVVLGGAAGAITNVAPGATGTVLTSNGVSADPSFQVFGAGVDTTAAMSADIVLTSTSHFYQVFTPTGDGFYIKLPDATTMASAGKEMFVLRNEGIYWVGVKNSAGLIISFVPPKSSVTVDLEAISAASGPWNFRIGNRLAERGVFVDNFTGLNSWFGSGAALHLNTVALSDTSFLLLMADSSSVTNASITGLVMVVGPTGFTSASASPVTLLSTDMTNTSDNGYCCDVIDASHVFVLYNSTAQTAPVSFIITITSGVPSGVPGGATPQTVGSGAPTVLSCAVNPGGASALCAWKVTTVQHVAHVGISGATVSPGTQQTFTPANTFGTVPIFARTCSATQGFVSYGCSGTVSVLVRMINTNGATTTPTTTLGTTENNISTLIGKVDFACMVDSTHGIIGYNWGNLGGARAKMFTLGANDLSAIGSEVQLTGVSAKSMQTNAAVHAVKISSTTIHLFAVNQISSWGVIENYALKLTAASNAIVPSPPIIAFESARTLGNNGAGSSDMKFIPSSGNRVCLGYNQYDSTGFIQHSLQELFLAEAA